MFIRTGAGVGAIRPSSASVSAVAAVVDAVFGSYDLKIAKQWRDEDLEHREQEKQRREDAIMREIAWRNADLERERRMLKLENEKRIIAARSRQLASVSGLSAFLAAISMCSIVEMGLPDDASDVLLVLYGGVCCLEFVLMVLCMFGCTLLHLAVTRFVTHTLEHDVRHLKPVELDLVSPFHAWWWNKCEREWLFAYKFFRFGLSLFLVEVALIGWVRFGDSVATVVSMNVLCAGGILYYQLSIASRWQNLVKFPEPSGGSFALVGEPN